MKQYENLEKRLTEQDTEDMMRPDLKENEILQKYRRWEKILDDQLEIADKLEVGKNKEGELKIRHGKIEID